MRLPDYEYTWVVVLVMTIAIWGFLVWAADFLWPASPHGGW